MANTKTRQDYEGSCKLLQKEGWIEEGSLPPMPEGPPRSDDDVLGVNFFRTRVADGDMSNLTLPRTYFGRSEICDHSFCNTDLTESTLCWNDFIRVDFSEAVLANCDLRASDYENVSFARADLRNSDLRLSTFKNCDFAGADLHGTKLTKRGAKQLALSTEQLNRIDWQKDEGDEPDGG